MHNMSLSKAVHSDVETPFAKEIPISTLRALLTSKYDIGEYFVDYSLDILTAFFKEKQKNPHRLLVLPQISDWAWHEFILLSAQYSEFSNEFFGGYLPHMKIVPDDDAYEESKRVFRRGYGFDTQCAFWEESGWTSPAYRFHKKWRAIITEIERSIEDQLSHSVNNTMHTLIDYQIDLSWLVQRIADRFAVGEATAEFAVHAYIRYLIDVRNGKALDIEELPGIVLWAWQEHMLWTENYKNDCMTLFGEFFHRPEVQAFHLFTWGINDVFT